MRDILCMYRKAEKRSERLYTSEIKARAAGESGWSFCRHSKVEVAKMQILTAIRLIGF